MAITKDPGRQDVQAAVLTFTYVDAPVGSTDFEAIDLPAGAVVTGGYVECVTAYTSATSPTVDLQIDNVSYLASAVALAAGTGAALVPTGTKLTANNTIDVTIGGSGTATAGEVRVIVQYVVDGKADASFG